MRRELVSNEVFNQPNPGLWGGFISNFLWEGAFKFPKDGSVLALLGLVNVLPKVLRMPTIANALMLCPLNPSRRQP